MANGRNLHGRLLRLEQTMPSADDQAEFRARMDRARGRIFATMTNEEQVNYLASRAGSERRVAERRGRKATLTARLLDARGK